MIGPNWKLSPEDVTRTTAILALRRVGKTYTASVIAEEMYDARVPWVVLDPTGAWWGMRSRADGKDSGLPVVILGGAHGDVPLEETAGKFVAELVLDEPGWYIIDFSLFESARTGYSPEASTIGAGMSKLRGLGIVDGWRLSNDFAEAIA